MTSAPAQVAKVTTDSGAIGLIGLVGLQAGGRAPAPLHIIHTEGDGAYWFHFFSDGAWAPVDDGALLEVATLDCPHNRILLQDAAPQAWVESPGEEILLGPSPSKLTVYHSPNAELHRLELRRHTLGKFSPKVTFILAVTRFFALVVGGFLSALGLLAAVVLLLGSRLRQTLISDEFETNWTIIFAALAASALGLLLFACGYWAGRLPWIAARDQAEESLDAEVPDYIVVVRHPTSPTKSQQVACD